MTAIRCWPVQPSQSRVLRHHRRHPRHRAVGSSVSATDPGMTTACYCLVRQRRASEAESTHLPAPPFSCRFSVNSQRQFGKARDLIRMTRATQLAVFYATDSKILRRKVIPDNDSQLARLKALKGQSMILLPLALPFDDASCRAAIAAVTGVTPPSGRCCVVGDTGVVIDVRNADPSLDSDPRGVVVASEHAGCGDRYIDGVFLRHYEIVNRSTNKVLSTAWLPIVGPTTMAGVNLVASVSLSSTEAPPASPSALSSFT